MKKISKLLVSLAVVGVVGFGVMACGQKTKSQPLQQDSVSSTPAASETSQAQPAPEAIQAAPAPAAGSTDDDASLSPKRVILVPLIKPKSSTTTSKPVPSTQTGPAATPASGDL